MKKINILPPVLCLFAALPLLAANVPVIEKLGTTEIGLVETNPVNYDGKTYVCESVRMGAAAVELPQPYVRLRDAADVTRFSEPFGRGLFFACAYADGDKMIVTGTKGSGDDTIYQTDTTDLVHWSEPRPILHGEGWQCYNTSVCKADGRYVMVYERGGTAPDVGTQFTMFFAESTDLKSWKTIDGAVFGRDFYTGSPCLKHHDGWFYFFYLAVDGFQKTPEGRDIEEKPLFRMRVVRSRNLKDWERGNRVVLGFDANDRRVYPGIAFSPEGLKRIATAELRNASDIDMCETKDGLLITYSWGNQQGVEHSALARVAGCSERAFCESFFDEAWAMGTRTCVMPDVFASESLILFMGDSITHGGRLNDMNHYMGHGYQAEIAMRYLAYRPDLRLSFANRGISGDTSADLVRRWNGDAIPLVRGALGEAGVCDWRTTSVTGIPDVVSILVGINDYMSKDARHVTAADYERNLRTMVANALAAKASLRIVLCQPFRLPEDASPDFLARQQAAERVARECNLAWVPFQRLFSDVLMRDCPRRKYWFWDGYHPTYAAHMRMADFWLETVAREFAAGKGRPLTLMTYNIRHGESMDGTLDLPAAGHVMLAQGPRFVGVQEVDVGTTRLQGRSNVAALAEATGYHVTFAKSIDVLGGQYGNAVLSREWPMAVRRIPLPGGEKRVLLLCEFADCWFGTTHLAVDSASARQESVEIIRRAVADCGGKPVFLTGDWNSEPDSAVLKGMRSFMTILSPTDRNTFHGGRAAVKPGDPDFCIDYIAVDRKHADRWTVRKARVVEDRRTSDHFPVLVDLVVAGTGK